MPSYASCFKQFSYPSFQDKLHSLSRDHASLVRLVKDVSNTAAPNPEASAIFVKAKGRESSYVRKRLESHFDL